MCQITTREEGEEGREKRDCKKKAKEIKVCVCVCLCVCVCGLREWREEGGREEKRAHGHIQQQRKM